MSRKLGLSLFAALGAALVQAPRARAQAPDGPPPAQEPSPPPPTANPSPTSAVADIPSAPGTPTAAVLAPPAPPANDALPLDLIPAASGLETTDEDARKLDIYGFADAGYYLPLLKDSNPWRQFLPGYSTFLVGNLNLYLDTTITKHVRSLVEVRFLYSPQGSTDTINANGSQPIVSTTVTDPAEIGHMINWGGIMIERAWVEYRPFAAFAARAGQFLTPYGIWNVDHGSPTLIGIRRPYIILVQMFPERQTGLEFYGESDRSGLFNVGYHLTLSNGRGPIDAYQDLDSNKALGGRLFLSTLDNHTATVGFSFYKGRYTDRTYQWGANPVTNAPQRTDTISSQYDELSLACDLRLHMHGFVANVEGAYHELAHTAAGWSRAQSEPQWVDANSRSYGAYAQVGYRTSWFGVMPYATLEYYHPPGAGNLYPLAGAYGSPAVLYLGLNVRPIPDLTLKAEFETGRFFMAAPGSWGQNTINVFQAQVAWAF